MAASQLLFAGCYERFLLGFAPTIDLTSQSSSLVKKYTFAAHRSAVKCVASAGAYLVSGGADDSIHIYDLKTDTDLGFLINPGDGAVPALALFTPSGATNPSHMLSGSADGSISIWSGTGSWEHLKLMKGHKGAINSLAIHPSGRLALSTARDSAIRMWNLVKGRCTYTSKLDLEGDIVAFSPSGSRYSLVCGPKVSVHSAAGDGSLLASLTHTRRVQCMAQPDEDLLLTGCEDGSIRLWDLRAGGRQQAVMERAHASRVRGLCILQVAGDSSSSLQSLASASSDGVIKLWDVRMLSSSSGSSSDGAKATAAAPSPACVAEASTGARITCLCLASPPAANAIPTAGAAASAAAAAGGAKGRSKSGRMKGAIGQVAKGSGQAGKGQEAKRPAAAAAADMIDAAKAGQAPLPHQQQGQQAKRQKQVQQQTPPQMQEAQQTQQRQKQHHLSQQQEQAVALQQPEPQNIEQAIEENIAAQPSHKQTGKRKPAPQDASLPKSQLREQQATTAAGSKSSIQQQQQQQPHQQEPQGKQQPQQQQQSRQQQQQSKQPQGKQQPQQQQQQQQSSVPAGPKEKRKYSEAQLKKQAARASAHQAKKQKGGEA